MTTRSFGWCLCSCLLLLLLVPNSVTSFTPFHSPLLWASQQPQRQRRRSPTGQSSQHPTSWPHTSPSNTRLFMVFDFFKKQSQEGLDQLNNLADSVYKGKLGEGLVELATYTTESNAAFAAGLAKSRNRLLQNMESLFTGIDPEEVLEDLQDILLQADVGITVAEEIVEEVRTLREDTTKFLSRDDLMSILRGKLIESLDTGLSGSIQFASSDDTNDTGVKFPTVIFVMGANGMGKTTTIGKLAYRLRTEGNQTVMMAACDTFRAGAVEQLAQWAQRAEVDIFEPTEQATTPSAVLYAALDKACFENYDTLLVDTSGRLSNNEALNAELAKMKRVIQKRLSVENDDNGKPILNPNVPHETLLVLDAAQGRMALDSARVWNEEVGINGLVLTKLDGSARGGSVVAVSKDLGIPVKLVGVGEGIQDLRDFEPEQFVESLLGIGSAGGGASSAEGAKLAARLVELRKERDMRAKNTPQEKEPVMATPNYGTMESFDDDVAPVTTKTKSNDKKKKKKKKKK